MAYIKTYYFHLLARTGSLETLTMFGMLGKFWQVRTQPGSAGQPPGAEKFPPEKRIIRRLFVTNEKLTTKLNTNQYFFRICENLNLQWLVLLFLMTL